MEIGSLNVLRLSLVCRFFFVSHSSDLLSPLHPIRLRTADPLVGSRIFTAMNDLMTLRTVYLQHGGKERRKRPITNDFVSGLLIFYRVVTKVPTEAKRAATTRWRLSWQSRWLVTNWTPSKVRIKLPKPVNILVKFAFYIPGISAY